MADFKAGGTWPDRSERLMTVVMRGLMAVMWDFSRAVGKGSRGQVDGFILLMMLSTSRCVVVVKQQRGWEITGCGAKVGVGGVEEGEKPERMFRTLDLKASRMLLHRSSVVSLRVGVWGLRRVFMVVMSCL